MNPPTLPDIEQLRQTNNRLNRRCQLAESALPQWRKVLDAAKKSRPLGLGKQLLTWALMRQAEDMLLAVDGFIAEAIEGQEIETPEAWRLVEQKMRELRGILETDNIKTGMEVAE